MLLQTVPEASRSMVWLGVVEILIWTANLKDIVEAEFNRISLNFKIEEKEKELDSDHQKSRFKAIFESVSTIRNTNETVFSLHFHGGR